MTKIDYAVIDKIRMEQNSVAQMTVDAPASGAQTISMDCATIFVNTFPSSPDGKIYLYVKDISGEGKLFIRQPNGNEAQVIDDADDPMVLVMAGW